MPPSGQPLDPAFTDLPLRRLADAALSRARDLGAEHADFRLERIRDQHLRLRDGRCRAPPTARTSASPSGWSTTAPGGSPPAST